MARQLATAAINVARDNHYELNPVTGLFERGLLLEGSRTNPVLRSEEFDQAIWAKSVGLTVTANAATAPNGLATADLLSSDGTALGIAANGALVFTGDGEKVASIYLKAGSAPVTDISIYDATAAAHRHVCRVTWTAGVPALATHSGAGTRYGLVALTNGWYRVSFSALGVIAANNNRLLVYPASQSAVAGSVYAWGAQAEDGAFPSSYIPTTSLAVTRGVDSLAFPFTLPLQELTAFARFVDRGTGLVSQARVFQIGSSSANPNTIRVISDGVGRYAVVVNNGAADVTSLANVVSTFGALVELRAMYSAAGSVSLGVSINGAAEVVSIPTPASPFASFASPVLAVGSLGGAAPGFSAFLGDTTLGKKPVVVARGTKTMAQMRALAGVA